MKKWLGDVRMISYYEENTRDRDIENCELLTPIVNPSFSTPKAICHMRLIFDTTCRVMLIMVEITARVGNFAVPTLVSSSDHKDA